MSFFEGDFSIPDLEGEDRSLDDQKVRILPLIKEGIGVEVPKSKLSYDGMYSKGNQELTMLMADKLDVGLQEILYKHLVKKCDDMQSDFERMEFLTAFLQDEMDPEEVRVPSGAWSYTDECLFKYDPHHDVDVLVATGGPGEVLNFIYDSRPGDFKDVMFILKTAGLFEGYEYDDEATWHELLDKFRMERYSSRGLEKATKISQMNYIDRDQFAIKFNSVLSDVDEVKFVSSPASNVKPFSMELVTEANEVGIEEVKDDDIVVGTTVVGNQEGASGNDLSLLRELWKKAVNGVPVTVEVVMEEDFPPNIRGYIVEKGRPHNLTCVVDLHEEGEPLVKLFKAMLSEVMEANVERNKRFYDIRPVTIRPTYFTMEEALHYFRLLPRLRKRRAKENKPPFKNLVLKKKVLDPTNKKRELRLKELDEICSDPESKKLCVKHKWPHISGGIAFGGPVCVSDFGYGSAKMVFSSAYHYAMENGKNFYYSHNYGWVVAS